MLDSPGDSLVEILKGPWLDGSKIDCFNLCPQKYYYRYVMHIRPKGGPGSALSFGHAIHKAMEVLYGGNPFTMVICPLHGSGHCQFCERSNGFMPAIAGAFLAAYPEDPEDDKDVRTRSRGLEILTAYIRKYRRDVFKTLAVEVPFSIPFSGFTYVGRIDLIGQWENEEIRPVDHKHTTRFGEMFNEQFHLSGAITGYIRTTHLLTRASGAPPVTRAMINGLRVTTRIQDESFARPVTSRTPEEIAQWEDAVQRTHDRIQTMHNNEYWPRHAPFACWAYNKRCEYWSLCTNSRQTAKDIIDGDFEVVEWSPFDEI